MLRDRHLASGIYAARARHDAAERLCLQTLPGDEMGPRWPELKYVSAATGDDLDVMFGAEPVARPFVQ